MNYYFIADMFYNVIVQQIEDELISTTILQSLKMYICSRKLILDLVSNLLVFKMVIEGNTFWNWDK